MFFPSSSQFAENRKFNFCAVILAFYWFLGACFGIYLASASSEYNLSLMPILLTSNVSILGMLVVFTFPFVIAAVLAYFSLRHFLYFLGFCKAFCFSFASSCIFCFFGSAGWLMHALIMFSDTLLSVLLFWFLLRYIAGSGNLCWRDVCYCITISAVVICFDYYLVTPFLFSLV